MKYILLSDFLRAPAKALDTAIAEEAHIVSLLGMQFAYRVRRVEDPNDLPYVPNHPNFKVERISKSNLLAPRESIREMLNSCHMVLLYKHNTLEITMERMPFDETNYPKDDRFMIGKDWLCTNMSHPANADSRPSSKGNDSNQRFIKKAIKKDTEKAVRILAKRLLPGYLARNKEAQQPIVELVTHLINASANTAVLQLQQELKERT